MFAKISKFFRINWFSGGGPELQLTAKQSATSGNIGALKNKYDWTHFKQCNKLTLVTKLYT